MPDAPDIVLCSKLCQHNPADPTDIHRGYYTVVRRYEFYFRVAKQKPPCNVLFII